MVKSNAERQKAYRERHLQDLDGQGARLNTVIAFSAKCALERLAFYYGVTQRAALEKIIDEAEDRLLSQLDSNKQEAYFDMKLQQGN